MQKFYGRNIYDCWESGGGPGQNREKIFLPAMSLKKSFWPENVQEKKFNQVHLYILRRKKI